MLAGTRQSERLDRPAVPTLARPFHAEGWIDGEKVGGWRIIAVKAGCDVRVLSRHGWDHRGRFPGVAEAVRALASRDLVLDAEVAVFDADLVSRFHALGGSTVEGLVTPPLFIAFDCLATGGRDLRGRPPDAPGRARPGDRRPGRDPARPPASSQRLAAWEGRAAPGLRGPGCQSPRDAVSIRGGRGRG